MTEVMGPLTASADIYSLAKTCYTMLCGARRLSTTWKAKNKFENDLRSNDTVDAP
jgi:hypothetical protein